MKRLFDLFENEEPANEPQRYVISVILDEETCPVCRPLEGISATKQTYLPMPPFDECTSREGCRCFLVAIYPGEGKSV
jgi:hypothetical protein